MTTVLLDAVEYVAQHPRGMMFAPAERGAQWCATVHAKSGRLTFPEQVGTRRQPVRVERGMWIVDCPCSGAQMACRTDHRVFCPDCLNQNSEDRGLWATTVWPDEPTVLLIERALSVRPVDNRNWYPEESVADLLAENLEHGWV